MKAALVGDHIGPSLTPALHEGEGAALGIDYQYDRIDTGGTKLNSRTLLDLLENAQSEGLAGLNVTHPHKAEVVDLMDNLVGPAREIGAVNTVVFRDGRRTGHNTDYSGFRRALLDRIGPINCEEVLVAGAGGAGSAVALALADCGASVIWILDPKPGLATALAERHQGSRSRTEWHGVETIAQLPLERISGYVNCTPMGMASHAGMALDPTLLIPEAWVADIVYFPLETDLLKTARRQGRRVMDGTGMALWQAVEAFALITQHEPNSARMQQHLNTLLETHNSKGQQTHEH